MGEYYGIIKGDTRSLDNGSDEILPLWYTIIYWDDLVLRVGEVTVGFSSMYSLYQ